MKELLSAEPRGLISPTREPPSILALWSTNPNGERLTLARASVAKYRLECPQASVSIFQAPSLGEGWTAGLERYPWREYDYVHLMGDDVFVQPGFWQAAHNCLCFGRVPTPRMLGPMGELQRTGGAWAEETEPHAPARLLMSPFLTPAMLEACLPLPPIILYMDYWFTQRLREAGHEIVYEPGFVIRHHVTASDETARPQDVAAFLEAGGRLS